MATAPKIASTQSGMLISFVGALFMIGAALSPMPDALGGWLFGGIFLLAGFVCLRRSSPRAKSQRFEK